MRVRLIHRLLRTKAEAGEPASDAELLARFFHQRDEAAFELLLWRHAALVAGICRRVLRDEHLAEDAFQAAFLILARKAGSIRGANLAGWLFRVSRRVALRARKTASRITAVETPLARDPIDGPVPHSVEHGELLSVLDDEIARLPERFRLPVVLCYLEGLTTEEAAKQLGCPRGTILSRLATARERLAARLTRRGFTLPAAGIASLISPPSEAVVACRIPDTVRNAITFRLGASPGEATGPTILAEGVLIVMRTKQLLAATSVVITGLAMGYGLVTANAGAGGDPVLVAQSEPKAEKPKEKPPEDSRMDAVRRDANRRLLAAIQTVRDDIKKQERDHLRILEALNAAPGQQARAQESLSRLESEIARLEKEVLELETTLALLKKRLEKGPAQPSDTELEQLIIASPRVQILNQDKLKFELQLESAKKLSKGPTPAIKELETNIDELSKQLELERAKSKAEALTLWKKNHEHGIRDRMSDSEESLLIKKTVLEQLIKRQKSFLNVIMEAARGEQEAKIIQREIEAAHDRLKRLEAAQVQLWLESEAPVSSSTTDGKLDTILKELQELRREVKELRQQKK